MDSQVVELLGRHRLADELLVAGLEVAYPARDRGIDLIAFADLDEQVNRFVACPIQMKASLDKSFGVDRKYEKFSNLLLAFVWNLQSPDAAETVAVTYTEAYEVAEEMGWTKTRSWTEMGRYVTTRPPKHLLSLLEPYRITPAQWREKVLAVTRTAGE